MQIGRIDLVRLPPKTTAWSAVSRVFDVAVGAVGTVFGMGQDRCRALLLARRPLQLWQT